MPVMYRMTEWSGRGNVAEDEGVSCHANQLPRLLNAIFNILKRPAADQVYNLAHSKHLCTLPLDLIYVKG